MYFLTTSYKLNFHKTVNKPVDFVLYKNIFIAFDYLFYGILRQ